MARGMTEEKRADAERKWAVKTFGKYAQAYLDNERQKKVAYELVLTCGHGAEILQAGMEADTLEDAQERLRATCSEPAAQEALAAYWQATKTPEAQAILRMDLEQRFKHWQDDDDK